MIKNIKNILNEREESEIIKILNNRALMSGLKKIFLKNIYYNGTLKEGEEPEPRRNFIITQLYTDHTMAMDYNIDDARLGQKVRASVEAIRLIEQSFQELEALMPAVQKEEVKEPNPGS